MINTLGAGLNIWNAVTGFFSNLSKILDIEYLLYAALGLLFLVMLITLAVTSKTYDVKILKYVKNMNRYFKRNPHINEDNLIYVNNQFKRAPKNVRNAWQQYMLNRDKLPSDYMNTKTCVDQPLKASSHDNASKALHLTTGIISVLSFVVALIVMVYKEFSGEITVAGGEPWVTTSWGWIYVFTIPVLVYVLGTIMVIILRARHSAIVGDIYTEFYDFERYINKACSTMPSYIDYEILFTKKEIREGIPALQEYLEKRALEEQKEREQQELNALNFEDYNFEELGLENSLLIERAMRESEKFFNIKSAMNERIKAKQTEMTSYQRNFDEVTKEFEKKAQGFRENLKQLNEQLNSTSVNIEANYIKKRYREDQQKLQQLEKDYEIATIRFNKQQNEINTEIDAYKKDIETGKELLQRAMTEEGKTYANKIYGIINKKVVEQNKPFFDEQEEEIASLKTQIEQLNAEVKESQGVISDLEVEKTKLANEIQTQKCEIEAIKNVREYLTSPEFRQVVIDRKKARKESGIDKMSIEELRDRTATAEEQLKIANEKQVQLEKNESELMKKLKRLEESEKELIKQSEEVVLQETQPAKAEQKIEENEIDHEELMSKINATLDKLNEEKIEEKKAAKKKNLSSLQNNVAKLKTKKGSK